MVALGGDLQAYGLAGLREGSKAGDAALFLEGLLPLDDETLTLPCVRATSGRLADVRLFRAPEVVWVLLLDASAEGARQEQLQQVRNELSLLQSLRSRPPGAGDFDRVLAGVLPALEVAVFEPAPDGSLRLLGPAPDWLRRLVPGACDGAASWELGGGRFVFLEAFLDEARGAWGEPNCLPLRSDPWTESAPDGTELELQAVALSERGRPLLVVEPARPDPDERRNLLQRGRDLSLSHDRLIREIQKKEILLHCIVHDLAGPLSSMRVCLEMLQSESLQGPERDQMLEIGLRQSHNQEHLIREILDAFAAEVMALDRRTADPGEAPDSGLARPTSSRGSDRRSASARLTSSCRCHGLGPGRFASLPSARTWSGSFRTWSKTLCTTRRTARRFGCGSRTAGTRWRR